MSPLARLRREKKRLIQRRDSSLTPAKRLELAEEFNSAARTLFFAGMSARGIPRARALRLWRGQTSRPR